MWRSLEFLCTRDRAVKRGTKDTSNNERFDPQEKLLLQQRRDFYVYF